MHTKNTRIFSTDIGVVEKRNDFAGHFITFRYDVLQLFPYHRDTREHPGITTSLPGKGCVAPGSSKAIQKGSRANLKGSLPDLIRSPSNLKRSPPDLIRSPLNIKRSPPDFRSAQPDLFEPRPGQVSKPGQADTPPPRYFCPTTG